VNKLTEHEHEVLLALPSGRTALRSIDALTAENERLRAERDLHHRGHDLMCAQKVAAEARLATAVGLLEGVAAGDSIYGYGVDKVCAFLASAQPAAPAHKETK
jgi:hypothetical protein